VPAAKLVPHHRLGGDARRADSVFTLRDSLMRIRYPNAIAFNDAITASDLKDMDFKLQVDVVQFEDEAGQFHQKAQQTLTRALNSSLIARNTASLLKPDSVRQYVIFDPQTGPRLLTIPRPKMVIVPHPAPPAPPDENVAKVKEVKAYFDAAKHQNKDVFEDLYTEYQQVYVPLNKRINPRVLDSMLRKEFQNQAINSPFEFKVTSAKRDSVIFISASNTARFQPYNSYQTALFPKDMIRDAGLLTVTFPSKRNIISWQVVFATCNYTLCYQ